MDPETTSNSNDTTKINFAKNPMIIFLIGLISGLTLSSISYYLLGLTSLGKLDNNYLLTQDSVQENLTEITNQTALSTDWRKDDLKILEGVFENLNFPPSINKNTFLNWKDYNSGEISFKHPLDWGVGSKCEGEIREKYVGLGPELLEYPSSNCGTANTPARIELYFQDNYLYPELYRILKEQDIIVDDIKSTSYIYVIKDRSKAGSSLFNEVVIPYQEKYLIVRLSSSTNFIFYKNTFDKILTTIELDTN